MKNLNQDGKLKIQMLLAFWLFTFALGVYIVGAEQAQPIRNPAGTNGIPTPIVVAPVQTCNASQTPTCITVPGSVTMTGAIPVYPTGTVNVDAHITPIATPLGGFASVSQQQTANAAVSTANFAGAARATEVPTTKINVIINLTNTPTAIFTPSGTSPTFTPTPTNTPVGISFVVDTSASSAQTIAAAVSNYYNTLRGFTITNTTASTAGPCYISDGTVTLFGPIIIGGGNLGVNVDRPIYSAAPNRPLIFFNSGPVTNMQIAGQVSKDLATSQFR